MSGGRVRPEGCDPVRAGTLLPVLSLLRSCLREPAGELDDPRPAKGPGDKGEARREREHDGALPGEAQGDALGDLRPAVLEASRGGDGAAGGYEGVAGQAGEAGGIASLGVRSAVLGMAFGEMEATVAGSDLARLHRP